MIVVVKAFHPAALIIVIVHVARESVEVGLYSLRTLITNCCDDLMSFMVVMYALVVDTTHTFLLLHIE